MDTPPGSTTPYTILNRVRDLRDDPAWEAFYAFCDPLLRKFGRQLRLDPQTAEDVRREAWHRLLKKMQVFEYDPGRRFRHWLWIFFRRQALDHIKARRRAREIQMDFSDEQIQDLLPLWIDRLYGRDLVEAVDDSTLDQAGSLLATAEIVQEEVRSRVKESTWRAYWLVAIEGMTTEEAARALGMSYLTTYKSVGRVRTMLESRGRIHLERRVRGDSDV